LIDHKNPFYPVVLEGKIDLTDQTPIAFRDRSRFECVPRSLLSFPSNSHSPHDVREIQWSCPCFLKLSYFNSYIPMDARVGGFGVFFAWILVLSAILYAVAKKWKERRLYNVFLGILCVSLFILPYAWWARFFPYFYAFPLVMLLYTECTPQSRHITNFKRLIYLLLILNTLHFCCGVLSSSIKYTAKINKIIDVFQRSKDPVLINFNDNAGLKIKLDERNIRYEKTDEELGTLLYYIYPQVSLSPEQYLVEDHILIEKKP